MSDEIELGKRITLRIPAHMPELRRELDQFPEGFHTKRLLVLANLGLMVSQNDTIQSLVAQLVKDARDNTGGGADAPPPPPQVEQVKPGTVSTTHPHAEPRKDVTKTQPAVETQPSPPPVETVTEEAEPSAVNQTDQSPKPNNLRLPGALKAK